MMSGSNTTSESSAHEEVNVPALQAELASMRDRLLRALADAENTRRRAERSAADARQYAVADFARELLAVADNLQRAVAVAEHHNASGASLTEGLRATERLLTAILERFGVRRIEALGAQFDPMLHEAMLEVEDVSKRPGTVAEVMEHGYAIHDRLLRPARVIVTKHRPDQRATAEGFEYESGVEPQAHT